jgi:hypothetical protein
MGAVADSTGVHGVSPSIPQYDPSLLQEPNILNIPLVQYDREILPTVKTNLK